MSITENKKFSPRFLTGNMIKIIAAAFMVIDHIGVILMHEDGILRILGRISMPLFAYMIAEGAKYTKNKTKYLGMIAGLAAICQLVYYFALNDTYMCILVTFSLSIALIYALDFLKWAYLSGKGGTMAKIFSPLIFFGLMGLVYYLTTILMIDYGFFGIMMPVFASITDMRGYEIPEKLTWDFIWEVSDKATEKNPDGTYKINGDKVMIPFIYKSTDNMMIQMLKQKNAGYSTASGELLLCNDTTKELLYEIASHVKTGAFSTFKISSYPANFLNAGQCIFAIDSTAGATWMGSNAPLIDIAEDKLVQFETVIKTVPQFDPANPQMISQGPSMCVFNKDDPQEVLASWLFAQFMLTNEVQIAYSQTEGYLPFTT